MLTEAPDAPEGDPDAEAHDHHNFSPPTTGCLPHPLPVLAGAVVTGASMYFGVNCLPVALLCCS